VDIIEMKLVASTRENSVPLAATGSRSIVDWVDRNLSALTILVISVKNSCLHHITRVAMDKEA